VLGEIFAVIKSKQPHLSDIRKRASNNLRW